ncbi:MAG TPA: peptidoglycan DD-metalloendopeptidase family protein [Candidatus Acidoferrales bacterium]|nr:peptidoglycan DD-metalloendopeptidase family protein [Candidatus Acidoferrales bacterium]
MSRKKLISWLIVGVLALLAIAGSYLTRFEFESRLATELALAGQRIPVPPPRLVVTTLTVPRGVPFAAVLARMDVDPQTAGQITSAAESVFNFRMFEAGKELKIARTLFGQLAELRYRIDPERILSVVRRDGEFRAEVQTIPTTVDTDAVAGKVDGSLFEAVTRAGESPELAMRIADIFSWDLDFYTDPRPGDTFRVVVEKKKVTTGQTIAYGKILAAEYVNDGRPYRAVLFHDPSGVPGYYTPDGKSLKKAFLHSPLKFSAVITSHFSLSRYHPILKIYRPHLGTDYAAPTGTPVQSIGDGRVVFAGRKGEDGNLVKIQHSNGYETYYMHLSRILVREGQHVAQGQRIALVGMTGLATGPHLDFRIERHGQFLNFERLPLPPSEPVAPSDMAEFVAARDRAMALLPQPGTSFASAAAPASPPAPTAASSPR